MLPPGGCTLRSTSRLLSGEDQHATVSVSAFCSLSCNKDCLFASAIQIYLSVLSLLTCSETTDVQQVFRKIRWNTLLVMWHWRLCLWFCVHTAPCDVQSIRNAFECTVPVRTAQQTHSVSVTQTSQLMLYREIMAVCSEIHTKTHKYTVWAERRSA